MIAFVGTPILYEVPLAVWLTYIMLPSALKVSTSALGDTRSNLFLKVFQVTDSPFDKRFRTFCLLDLSLIHI